MWISAAIIRPVSYYNLHFFFSPSFISLAHRVLGENKNCEKKKLLFKKRFSVSKKNFSLFYFFLFSPSERRKERKVLLAMLTKHKTCIINAHNKNIWEKRNFKKIYSFFLFSENDCVYEFIGGRFAIKQEWKEIKSSDIRTWKRESEKHIAFMRTPFNDEKRSK